MNSLISVVIPTKNRFEQTINAVNSALNIKGVSEIIVIDDHSNFDIKLLEEKFVELGFNNIRVIENSFANALKFRASVLTLAFLSNGSILPESITNFVRFNLIILSVFWINPNLYFIFFTKIYLKFHQGSRSTISLLVNR